MTRQEAALKLSFHLMQCGMLMPIKWVENNGEGSETSEAFQMAIAALREPKVPCKPGDTVYRLCGQKGRKYVAERKVVSVALCGEQSWQILTTAHDWLGHTVFLTREEAEAKLRRLEEV